MNNNCICIIPARSGSVRIKNKNIINFLGKPIISYTIQNAIKSKCFKKVYVSTDSIKIKKIANTYGAEVPFLRSKQLSNNHVGVQKVINDFLEKLNKEIKIDKVCILYPTSIFASINLIKKSVKLCSKKIEYVSVLQKFPHPIERALVFKKKKFLPINKSKFQMRTQDLEVSFYDSGQIYVFNYSAYLKTKKIFNLKSKKIILNHIQSIDIDFPEDLEIAKKIYKLTIK